MAEHFVTKSTVDLGNCLSVNGVLAIDAFEKLHAFLEQRAGRTASSLFAEPLVSRGNNVASSTVAWYCDFPGAGVPVSQLDEEARADLTEVLERRLAGLTELIDDSDEGLLLAAALYTLDADSVWAVGGRPLILNWGMAPPDAISDPRSRTRHYNATLGRFLRLDQPPPLSAEDAPGFTRGLPGAATVAATSAAASATAAGAAASTTDTATPVAETTATSQTVDRVPLYAWVPLLVLLLLASGVLIWLLLPGNRIFAAQPVVYAVNDAEAVRLAEQTNAALEERIRELEKGLAGAVCEADGTLLMPDGVMIEGMLPPRPETPMEAQSKRVASQSQTALQPDPARLIVQGPNNQDMSLSERIEASTVMVVANTPAGITTGSGFVVGPGLVVTNFHVVETAPADSISVVSSGTGGVLSAEPIKSAGPFHETGRDLSLLQVTGLELPSFTLLETDASLRMTSVYAAGYPGEALIDDANFTALRQGATDAVPTLTITDGTMYAEDTVGAANSDVYVHSAPISQGNSGGPLVDACGRLVGVNTFVLKGAMGSANFALSTKDLLAFLDGTPALPSVVASSCEAEIARPSVRTVQNTQAAPAPGAPAIGNALPILPRLQPSQP